MLDFSPEGLAELLLRLPVILLALTIHELAHAWTADRLGDPTARYLGRITLNPLRHLDPLGTLCLLFAPIGWAKPVPVNPLNFRRPGRDDILVSIAGPASNLSQAILFALLLRLPWPQWLLASGSELPANILEASGLQQLVWALWVMISLGVILNVGLAFFNMLPFFPLDGHHVARENLRGPARERFIEMQPYGPFIILGLVMIDRVSDFHPISWPIFKLTELLVTYVGGGGLLLLP